MQILSQKDLIFINRLRPQGLAAEKFNLRKWVSSSEELMSLIIEDRASKEPIESSIEVNQKLKLYVIGCSHCSSDVHRAVVFDSDILNKLPVGNLKQLASVATCFSCYLLQLLLASEATCFSWQLEARRVLKPGQTSVRFLCSSYLHAIVT